MACSAGGSVLAAMPAAQLMAKHGRRVGFVVGAVLFVAGGLLGALAMSSRSFALQLVAVSLTGMGIGFDEYLRFAAAEVVPPKLEPRAIALSVAGSVLGAFGGPQIAKATRNMLVIEFQASYLSNAFIAVLYIILILVIPGLPTAAPAAVKPVSDGEVKRRRCSSGGTGSDSAYSIYRRTPALVIATLSQAIGFGSMIISMTATPLAMKAEGFSFEETATTIQTHAMCMFAPGLFSGEIIRCIGEPAVMLLGCVLMVTHSFVALSGVGRWHFGAALMLSGVGWNFLFVSGSSLLVAALPDTPQPVAENAINDEGAASGDGPATAAPTPPAPAGSQAARRLRIQGVSESLVWTISVVAATTSGLLLQVSGWTLVHIVDMVPVALFFCAVCWFALASGSCCKRYTAPAPAPTNP